MLVNRQLDTGTLAHTGEGDLGKPCTRSDLPPGCTGLIVAFGGISPTIFESQVMIHAEVMRSLGVDLAVWVFALNEATHRISLKRRADLESKHGVPIRVLRGIRTGLPLAEAVNAFYLWRALRKCNICPQFVHARTDYSALVCGLVGLFVRYELIWDCRGDAVAEFLMAGQATRRSRFIQKCKSMVIAAQRFVAQRLSDKAIFVSEELKRRCLGRSFAIDSEVIPCVASKELFYFLPVLRRTVRQALHIDDDQIALIYSGSITYYQCFNEAVDLFSGVLKYNDRAVFLVVTPDRDEVAKLLQIVPSENVRIVSAEIRDVNGFLNAADFGVFLRQRCAVNAVASPVKFAEYCLSGLPIIMTDAVEQSTKLARLLGNAVEVELGQFPDSLERWSDERREALAERAVPLLDRSGALDKFLKLYGCGTAPGTFHGRR